MVETESYILFISNLTLVIACAVDDDIPTSDNISCMWKTSCVFMRSLANVQ